MDQALHANIIRKLESDYGFKQKGKYLQQGECPICKKREMYTSIEKPWVLRCGRLDKCGETFHVKELYDDLFSSWSDRYQTTEVNPNAAADAYMAFCRGFDIQSIAGWYKQSSFYSHKLQMGSATVRFDLDCGAVWERIIDQPHRFGKQKANFIGQYQGHWWQAPGADLTAVQELWITEGNREEFAEACWRKSCFGFLVQFATPVMKPHFKDGKVSGGSYSWGYYNTGWFYGETFEEATQKALAWAASKREEEEKKAGGAA